MATDHEDSSLCDLAGLGTTTGTKFRVLHRIFTILLTAGPPAGKTVKTCTSSLVCTSPNATITVVVFLDF